MDLKFALRSLRNNPGSGNISVPDFQDWKHQSTAFSATAYYVNYSTVAMTGPAAEWFRIWWTLADVRRTDTWQILRGQGG